MTSLGKAHLHSARILCPKSLMEKLITREDAEEIKKAVWELRNKEYRTNLVVERENVTEVLDEFVCEIKGGGVSKEVSAVYTCRYESRRFKGTLHYSGLKTERARIELNTGK